MEARTVVARTAAVRGFPPESTILTMDGVGEWATTSIGVGRGADMEVPRRPR